MNKLANGQTNYISVYTCRIPDANHYVIKLGIKLFFCMKYRKKFVLSNDILNYFKYIYFEIFKRYCFEFDAIGTNGDNVHFFAVAEPKTSPSKVMWIIKSIRARKIFKKYYEI
jgi:putative transposase